MNYAAILVASVLSMVIGAFWYSANCFGKQWAKECGFDKKAIKKANEDMGRKFGFAMIATAVTATVLAYFMDNFVFVVYSDVLLYVFMIWLGFVAPIMYGRTIWNKDSTKLLLIDASYQLVSLWVMASVIFYWF